MNWNHNIRFLKSSPFSDELFSNQQLKSLIFPLIIEQILAITVGLVDTVMISYAGEAAMSGVSLVDMINNLIICILSAVATGGAVIVSQYIGKKKKTDAVRSANQLMLCSILLAVLITIFIILFRRTLLNLLFGAIEPDVMENALIYLLVSAFSYPFLGLFNACAAAFRSIGNSKISMYVSIGMNIMNAIGNAILIFGFRLGAFGAAFSSLIARMTAAIIIFILICNKKNEVYVEPLKIFHADLNIIKKIMYIAIPNGIENGLFQLGRVLVVSIIALFGTTQIAANAVANTMDSMGCIAGQAMNLAMITVVGQCMGAGRSDQAEYYTKKLLRITYAITIVVNSVILLFLPLFLQMFTMTQETHDLAYILIMIHNGLAMIFWPVSFTLSFSLRASGDVKFTMVIAIFSMISFRIFFSIILGVWCGMGAVGVWIAMVLDWIFRSAMFIIRFKKGKWKELRLV